MAPLIKMGIRFRRNGKIRFFICGRNSAVECQLPKLDVVGSSPIARSIFYPPGLRGQKFGHILFSSCNRFGCVLGSAKIIGGF